jgi:hypothetical protein
MKSLAPRTFRVHCIGMKAVINGVRFDTEKATLIGSAQSAHASSRDFGHWEADLYKTPKSGRYFLAGEGGPMSRFAESTGQNSWSGGSGIQPMDESDAFEWAQQYLTTEEVEEAFAHLIEEA